MSGYQIAGPSTRSSMLEASSTKLALPTLPDGSNAKWVLIVNNSSASCLMVKPGLTGDSIASDTEGIILGTDKHAYILDVHGYTHLHGRVVSGGVSTALEMTPLAADPKDPQNPTLRLGGDSILISIDLTPDTGQSALPTLYNGKRPKWICVGQEGGTQSGFVRCGNSSISATRATSFVVPHYGHHIYINCAGCTHVGWHAIDVAATNCEIHVAPMDGDPPIESCFQQQAAGVIQAITSGAEDLIVLPILKQNGSADSFPWSPGSEPDDDYPRLCVVQIEAGSAGLVAFGGRRSGAEVTISATTGTLIPLFGQPIVVNTSGCTHAATWGVGGGGTIHFIPIAGVST